MADFALEVANKALSFYIDYFGTYNLQHLISGIQIITIGIIKITFKFLC